MGRTSKRFMPALAAAAGLLIAMAGLSAAHAQSMRTTDASGFGATPFPYLDEIRLGAFVHQVGGSPNEHGADVNAEILFGKIGAPRGDYLLDYFLRPRIHLGADINVTGYTSVAYTGLTWDMPLTSRFFLETSFGGAIHDGNLDQKAHYTALGCRVNFRKSASIGFHLSERWDFLTTVDHMSNAGLCSNNRGLTDVGVRLGYKW